MTKGDRATCWAGLMLAVGMTGCGTGHKTPPAPPPRQDALEAVLQVAHDWQETTRVESFSSEPDVAFKRSDDKMLVHLEPGKRIALVSVERQELIRTPQGREYHCEVAGAIQAVVHFDWRLEEASMVLRVPATSLDRRCKEQGFDRRTQQLEAVNTTYVLRGDQLLAVEPAKVRSTLLPAD